MLPGHAATAVMLWDFSGGHRHITAPVPTAPGDLRKTARWYWEFTYFKPALGERMLARMLGTRPAGRFGAVLTQADVALFLHSRDRQSDLSLRHAGAAVARVLAGGGGAAPVVRRL
ncbi:MAG: hypothetical protein ACREFY_18625, partial [Acetobacteraceae bacterium]